MKTESTLAEQAQEKLGDALAEHVWAREQAEPRDKENRRYLLNDLNGLLSAAGPGAELQPSLLNDPRRLQSHLRASLEIPAQVLARELPNRLKAWLAEEPKPVHPEHGPAESVAARALWAEKGRWLLDQARTNQSNLS